MRPQHPPATDPRTERLLARMLGLARWVLWWERAWPLILPPLALAGTFVALALLDVLPLLPAWLHALVLALGAGGFAYLLARIPLKLGMPGADEAARRLERDSGFAHRPLAVLADRPVGDDPLADALFQAHRDRMRGRLAELRLNPPHPGMAARDPLGWRAAVLLLLVIAWVGGGHDPWPRLVRAATPALNTGLVPDAVEVWITPPDYTGLAPFRLVPGEPAPRAVPAGSAVLAVLNGGWGRARLLVDDRALAFADQGENGQRVETRLDRAQRLAIRQAGREVASWPVQVVADATPSIAFTLPPEAAERGRLRLVAEAEDDHGLVRAWVNVSRIGAPGDSFEIALPLPGGAPKKADVAAWQDLTAHPWAGLPVSLQPAVADALGQTGTGEAVTITLPERVFSHPTARALVEQRRLVTEHRANAPGAMGVIDRLSVRPEDFNDDMRAFLAMRAARHALGERDFDLARVQDLLWNAALRIEDGDLASAERGLEDARQALEQALAEGASAEDVEQLLEEFGRAMERYLDALAERMAREGAPPPQGMSAEGVISDEDLRAMLDGMRDMAGTGAREALRQMLRDLSQVLDSLQAGPPPPPDPQAMKAMEDLRGLARRQQEMMDQSHRRAQQGGAGADARSAAAQDQLRRALGDVAGLLGQRLGEAPPGLAEAERAMEDAAGDLRRGDFGPAAEAQAQALQQMNQAAREAMEQMAGSGMAGMAGPPRDPLGRPTGGSGFGDDGATRIPERAEIQRAHRILDELRRRAGEWQRPEDERDYLRRLLKRF